MKTTSHYLLQNNKQYESDGQQESLGPRRRNDCIEGQQFKEYPDLTQEKVMGKLTIAQLKQMAEEAGIDTTQDRFQARRKKPFVDAILQQQGVRA